MIITILLSLVFAVIIYFVSWLLYKSYRLKRILNLYKISYCTEHTIMFFATKQNAPNFNFSILIHSGVHVTIDITTPYDFSISKCADMHFASLFYKRLIQHATKFNCKGEGVC